MLGAAHLRGLVLGAMMALCLTPARGQTPASNPVQEDIGSWLLRCPGGRPGETPPRCVLRHRDWVLPPGEGGASAALEVQTRGDVLVPIVTLRGLSTPANLGGSLVVTLSVALSLDGGEPVILRCGSSGTYFACAPEPSALHAVAGQLPKARTLSVDFSLTIPGLIGLPPQRQFMDLSGTPRALGRLVATGPPDGESLPALEGLDIRGFADRVLSHCGYPHGVEEAAPLLLGMILARIH